MTDRTFIADLADFDIDLTLRGGQAFRWTRTGDVYLGVAEGHLWRVGYTDGRLVVTALSGGDPATFARRYFDLDRDYAGLLLKLQQIPEFLAATGDIRGLRVLRQDWFETLVTFIVSANNHIKRIASIVAKLAETHGERLPDSDSFRFPTPTALASTDPARLREICGTGYRDRYIVETAAIASTWPPPEALPTNELRHRLRDLPGVGPKVAECVLLFGFGRFDAFPVDTWVRRAAIEAFFPSSSRISDERLREFGLSTFGDAAGLAQQYLFEAIRRRNSHSK